MQPTKLGIFIPYRPEGQIGTGGPGAAVGCLRDPIHAELLHLLREHPLIDLSEGLNFRRADLLNGDVWVGRRRLNEFDAFFWYCEVERQRDSFDMEVLRTLSRDVRVIRDPNRFLVAVDKYQAHMCLRDSGIPVPDFMLFDGRITLKIREVMEEWGAAMLKPRVGGWGKGVTLIDSATVLRDVAGYIQSIADTRHEQGFFLERYLTNDPERWASLTVIGGEVAYGYRKQAHKLSDLGNGRIKVLDEDEKGGGVELVIPEDAQIDLAERSAKALGLGLVGFDMIHTPSGPVIVDENTSPGNYAKLYEEVGKSPGKLLSDWIVSEAHRV